MTNTGSRLNHRRQMNNPFPLPPFVVPTKPSSKSRRVIRRFQRRAAILRCAAAVVEALNCLSLSSVFSVPLPSFVQASTTEPMGSAPSVRSGRVTAAQKRLRAAILRRAAEHVARTSSASASATNLRLPSHYSQSTTAIPVIASRVALPPTTKAVKLVSVLPPEVARTISDPALFLKGQLPDPDQLARYPASVYGTQQEYVQLCRKMHGLDMTAYMEAGDVARGRLFVLHP